jgi:hypothetical protein
MSAAENKVFAALNRSLEASQGRPFNETKFTMDNFSEFTKLGVLIETSLKARSNLDWALIEITVKDMSISNAIFNRFSGSINPVRNFSSVETDIIEVVICTGSNNTRNGIMSASSTFLKIEHSDTFEEVGTVTLNGSLCKLVSSFTSGLKLI